MRDLVEALAGLAPTVRPWILLQREARFLDEEHRAGSGASSAA
ncbi:hypothetical protein [Nocardioides marmoriginsengisoli]|nr:hypothetical protein [Nocardioides marmoriginsengisoli]